MNSTNFYRQLLEGILLQAILAVASIVFRKARAFLGRSYPLARPVGIVVLALIFVGTNVFILWRSIPHPLLLFCISVFIFGWVVFAEFEAFWRLGLIGTDRTIAKGIDYRKSLNLCKDSLEFLGIGANKLVNEQKAFRDAINRCHRPDHSIRFLLCPPDHEELIRIARQAGRPETEYQEKVKSSLRELCELKNKHGRNIEVKFYKKLPLFRLMFINDTFCLASHYILGEGEGSQLPQLHLWRKPPGRRDIESLYSPLRRYYDQLWQEAEPWNFETYL